MPPPSSTPRRLLGAALLALACASGCTDKPAPPPAEAPCDVPADIPLLAQPDADDPPVLLWAVGPVKLSVDGAVAFSPPDEPRHFRVGEHSLRAEAPGQEPLTLRFRLEPFSPAFFHAQVDEGIGLSVVSLGAPCTGCGFADTSPSFDPVPPELPVPDLLGAAASALRRSDWRRAVAFLRQVPPRHRHDPRYLRLEAAARAAGLQPDEARAALQRIPKASSNDLARVLDAHTALERTERTRREQVLLVRWNRLAERFGALVARFQQEAPSAVAAHTPRFESLSRAYAIAARDKRLSGQQAAVDGAEATVRQLAKDIRAARPSDCALQKNVVGALVR